MKRVILFASLGAAAFFLPVASQATLLDFGPSGQRLEPGATGLPGAPANWSGNVDYPSTDLGSGISLAIDTLNLSGIKTGNLDWRDRGDGSNDSLVRIGEDFVKNNSGFVRLTFEGIAAGYYHATSWHIDPDYDQSESIVVWLDDDGLGFVDTGARGNAGISAGGVGGLTTSEVQGTTASFSFTSDGVNPVILLFDGSSASDTEVPVNGIEFILIPEPTTAFGLLGLISGAFCRRRRRLTVCD